MQTQLDEFRNKTMPQVYQLSEKLREQEGLIKSKMGKEFQRKEEQLRGKYVKQKYQLQEQLEKCKFMTKQNTELKIQNEGIRYQLS